MCGERSSTEPEAPAYIGSAPRVRGTGRMIGARVGLPRFSPACAGNGLEAGEQGHGHAVQPRVCGERLVLGAWKPLRPGSAPRVRGTDLKARHDDGQDRFSPACAGNGARRFPVSTRVPVQPRVCGERGGCDDETSAVDGSAPRVRGTATPTLSWIAMRRFSPACAGNGSIQRSAGHARAVQPRVCGERGVPDLFIPAWCGSAPRVRGTASLTGIE